MSNGHEQPVSGHVEKIRRKYTKQQRTKAALAMRLGGATYPEMADHFGVSLSTVHGDVRRALQDIPKDAANELREAEAMKLDRLQRAVWTKALDGNLGAVDRVLAIIRQRARLFGLDAPQQVQVAGGSSFDLDAVVRDLAAASQEPPAPAPPELGEESVDNG